MTELRMLPTKEFLYELVSVFVNQPDIQRAQEIYIHSRPESDLIRGIVSLYPKLKMYYYPCTLETLTTRDHSGNITFTLSTCVQILRQMLRAYGYKVRTHTNRRRTMPGKVMVIIPPSNIPSSNTPSSNTSSNTPP